MDIFTFCYPHNDRESISLCHIFEKGILLPLYVIRSLESVNCIFSIWSVCMCVCVSVISITEKQITAEALNLVFYICIIHRCYLKLFFFYKDQTKTVCTGTHKRILIHYGLWTEFLINEFQYI